MKKLIILVILLLSTVEGFSQYSDNPDVNGALESIRVRGIERDVDIDSILSIASKNGYLTKLDSIKLVDKIIYQEKVIVGDSIIYRDVSLSAITRYRTKRTKAIGWHYVGTIEIENRLLLKPNVLETVVAHEIGHILDLPHVNREVSVMFVIIIEYEGLLYDMIYGPYSESRWDEYFDLIKAKYIDPEEIEIKN